jgi:hypothetical protein
MVLGIGYRSRVSGIALGYRVSLSVWNSANAVGIVSEVGQASPA